MSSIDMHRAPGHDDMLGRVRTAITGAVQATIAQIRDTGFLLEWLMPNADDYEQVTIQVPHRRKIGSLLDSLHIHYVLDDTAPNEGEEVWIDYAYCWISPGEAVPAIVDWSDGSAVLTFDGTEGAHYYNVFSIETLISPPEDEGYGGMILLKMIRNSTGTPSDTYPGAFGVIDVDAHTPVDRLGSFYEFSDVA